MREQFKNGENGEIVEVSAKGIYEGIKFLLENPEEAQKYTNELLKINWNLQIDYNQFLGEFIE